jgi:hypothetical protein
LEIHLLVRLAAICPSDPFDGFWAWMGCSVLKAFGADPDKLRGDLVFQLLSNPSSPSASGCPSMLESFLGPHQSCLTEQLWQLMEPAGYVLIVAVLGARFGKMVASNNFSVSPGWAVADPVLRSVVAGTFVHLSYGLMIFGHSGMESVGVLLFGKITAAGGVTGIWLLDPAGAAVAASPSAGGALLVDIIHWLFSLYILVMVLASLVGFQVCVVLAPLVIPLWIFSGQNQVFSWFTKTVIGASILPVVVGVGWAVFLDLIHQFSVTQNPSVITIFAGWVLELVFVFAGVWFMTRFIKATTGEVFASQSLLSTIFMSEAVFMMSSRMTRGMMGHGAMTRFSGAVLDRAGKGKYTPHGLVTRAQQEYSGHLGARSAVMERVRTNEPTRYAMVPTMEAAQPGVLRAGRNVVFRNAWVAAKNGDWDYASKILNGLTIDPDGGVQRGAEVVMEALGRSNDSVWSASMGVASRESLSRGLGTPLSPAAAQGKGMLKDLIAEPDFQQRVGKLSEYVNDSRHHRVTPGQAPPMDAWLPTP